MEWFNDRNRRGGIIGAIAFHLVLLVVLMFLSMEPPYPPKPQIGMEVNLGDSDFGMGNQPVTEASQQASQPSASAAKNDVATQNSETTVNIKKGTKPKESQTTVKEDPKPNINNKFIFPGSKPKTGGSEGINGGTGNQGKQNGDVNSKNYDGSGGSGNKAAVSFILGSRGSKYLDKPINNTNETGKVVVEVTVDKKGKVIKAQVINSKTKTTSGELRKLAEKAAYSTQFDVDPNAPEEQIGTITYNFVTA